MAQTCCPEGEAGEPRRGEPRTVSDSVMCRLYGTPEETCERRVRGCGLLRALRLYLLRTEGTWRYLRAPVVGSTISGQGEFWGPP